ncbi:MAG: DnaJ family molecular chaperone [Kiloniellaceae bacterium]
MYEPDEKIEKWQTEVQVELDDGTRLLGSLFVKPMQRISDLLNDARQFLPFQTSGGLIVHLRKATIARVVQLEQEVEQDAITDPYEILGVSRYVSDEELKETYHCLCGETHPDKLIPLGLSPEFIKLANSRMIRIIDAYHRILTLRHGASGNGQDGNSKADPAL